jgi:RHS repeat-associated protein
VQSVGGNNAASNSSRYIYDALGRRLKKTITDPNGKQHITYYGWDGERLVHTECLKDDGTRDIEHTVYEPGSFTPLVRLSATTQGAPHTQPHLLVQMTQAGTPADKRDSSGNLRSLEMMQSMISAFPEHMQKEMEKSMKHMLEKGPSPTGRTIMSNMGIDPDSFVGGMREGIRQIEQEEQTRVEIHFYHCDHLGTPIALTDRNGKIVWAARYDSWGNIEEEFNPHNIEQNIRLPGQHHDRETGLHYNRHRYYDPKIGAYINQDPIGLRGGVNLYGYPKNPMSYTDPKGLTKCYMPSYDGPSHRDNVTGTGMGSASAAARTAVGRATPIGTAVSAIEVTGVGLVQALNMEACREERINNALDSALGNNQPEIEASQPTEQPLSDKQKAEVGAKEEEGKCYGKVLDASRSDPEKEKKAWEMYKTNPRPSCEEISKEVLGK